MSHSSSLQFSPSKNLSVLVDLFPFCSEFASLPDQAVLSVLLDERMSLSFQNLGRLMVLNGKCRAEGIRLIVKCSARLFQELHSFWIDRIVWIEQS